MFKSGRLIALALLILGLTACGSSSKASPSAKPTLSTSPSIAISPTPSVSISPASDLSGISVSSGDLPKVQVKAPWAISTTTIKVIKEGTSAQVVQPGEVTIRYLGVNGRTGEVFDQNFDTKPLSISVPNGVIKGFATALMGKKVGSRILVAIPPADGYPEGSGEKIHKGDSLIFLIDILAAEFGEPSGKIIQTSGAPQVSMTGSGPSISTVGVTKPTSTQSSYLIEGNGPAIKADDKIKGRFRSFTWNGKIFEDAWTQQQPAQVNELIPGLKQGLIGKKVGSRILIVMPAAQAYPEGRTSGQPTLGPGEPLIYVADITYVTNN